MKNIEVKYNENGKITNVSDNSLHFEQENESLCIKAQLTVDDDKSVRAYIKGANNNSDVTEAISKDGEHYPLVISNEYMSKGTLYIGFEVFNDSGYIERYEPLKVYIDGFVNPGNGSSDNVYVVTVDVAEVETLEPDSPAYVENIGTKKDMRLKIGIPQGKKGESGDKGEKGDTGEPGVQGEPGYSPVKGKDYFTAEEQQGFKADILAEINPVLETKASARTQKGGFNAGDGAVAAAGGAIGGNAQAGFGGAVGRNTYTDVGGAIGLNAKANAGGAIGWNAKAGAGFSGGSNATTGKDSEDNYIDAIQLGMGTNNKPKTLQIYEHTLLDADGTIPEERLPILKTLATIEYVDEKIGDIDTLLDSILAIEQELIGETLVDTSIAVCDSYINGGNAE